MSRRSPIPECVSAASPPVAPQRGRWLAPLVMAVAAVAVVLLTPGPADAAGCPAPGGVRMPRARPAPADFEFTGHGWGHGVGMSQYGAQGAARLGCSAGQILRTYYRGIDVASTSTRESIVVGLAPNTPSASLPGSASVEHVSGRPIIWRIIHAGGASRRIPVRQRAGETWTVRSLADGRLELRHGRERVWRGGRPGVSLHAHHHGRTVALSLNGIEYRRGTLQFTSRTSGGAGMYVRVDVPSIEAYLYGLAEVPSSWPQQALRAQAIVARSYAKIARTTGSRWSSCLCHIYDSVYDQAYRGYDKESERIGSVDYGVHWVRAVNGTVGKVIAYNGEVVRGFYASSHGGHSASSHSVWGGDVAYLQAVDDSRWDSASDNPNKTWTASFSATDLGRRFGVGIAVSVEKARPTGAAGRVGEPRSGYGGLVVHGTRGTEQVSGESARRILGLKSALFRVRSNAVPLTGDWDGDGRDEPGWFRSGVFSLRYDDGVRRFRYGNVDDTPLVGDWNADGRDTVGVHRGNRWYLRNHNSRGRTNVRFRYGRAGDDPLVGNWNGRGGDTIGVRRRNRWFLRNANSAGRSNVRLRFGRVSDRPLVGDWNADGRDGVGVHRGGVWYLRDDRGRSRRFRYGSVTDVPLTGDWNRDRRDTIGVVRGHDWYLRNANSHGSHNLRWRFAG